MNKSAAINIGTIAFIFTLTSAALFEMAGGLPAILIPAGLSAILYFLLPKFSHAGKVAVVIACILTVFLFHRYLDRSRQIEGDWLLRDEEDEMTLGFHGDTITISYNVAKTLNTFNYSYSIKDDDILMTDDDLLFDSMKIKRLTNDTLVVIWHKDIFPFHRIK